MNDVKNLILRDLIDLKPVFWINPGKKPFSEVRDQLELGLADIIDASERLERFAPLIQKLFPETGNGIIESELTEIPAMKREIESVCGKKIEGSLFLKRDSELKIAGSVKARGGIYEVLKHAEELALSNGLLALSDDYALLADEMHKRFFSGYKIAVGSTGNLGMSIGIMGAALGFQVIVHMSRDAKDWKKERLRASGVEVVEHAQDYGKAVEAGRAQCKNDPKAYFIDDENSKELFLGYSVAALRLKQQLEDKEIVIDAQHKLCVYLPCGVGGAPCGIAFGLKHVFGDDVRCFFAEPTHSPCMLLALLTGNDAVHVNDYGIDNITQADGLAVGSPSKLAARIAIRITDGMYTVGDGELFRLLALLKKTQNIKIEPSAAAGLAGPGQTGEPAAHIAWATGGLLVPEPLYVEMVARGSVD